MSSRRERECLLYALRLLLRPIVRLLIRVGLRFDELAALARGVYVESAVRDGIGGAGLPTRERISVVTGVSLRDVNCVIDNEGTLPTPEPTLAAVLMEILHKWHTSPRYAGPYGIPLELELERPPHRSFRSLVGLVNAKVEAKAVLEELLRLGIVVPAGDGHFRAVSRTLMMPDPTSSELIEHLGRTLPRLATTLEYNLNPQHPEKRLERFVTADIGLPREVVPKFEEFARSRATDLLVDLDNWLAPHAADDTDEPDRVETGLNVFLYAAEPVVEPPLKVLVEDPPGG